MAIKLDSIDRKLINMMQSEFPLVREPFADMGARLGLTGQEVLQRAGRLRDERIVRIIGPVFNSRTLGYLSTLVAMRVPEGKVEYAAEIINAHHGVGHDYQRDHYYNIWFTLAIRSDSELNQTLREFEERIRPEKMLQLRAVRLFKIRLFFDLENNGGHFEDAGRTEASSSPVILTDIERAVINEVQQQLPLTPRPFDGMSENLDMEVRDFLSVCRSLLGRGIMRRFGASIEHQNAGFTANAMVCWAVPPERVVEVGHTMAGFREVTHCYERDTGPDWPRFNIFTMIHGGTTEENEKTVSRMAGATAISDYEILSTVREFKKERVKYSV